MAKHHNSNSSSGKIWGTAIGVLAVAIIGIIMFSGNKPSETSLLLDKVSSGDHVRGDAAAKVTFVEYGDYQCPACAAYNPMVSKLASEYGDRIAIVYRNFPLRQIHPNADLSAQAAEAAGKQGKFWEMNEMIYANQSTWEKSPAALHIFLGYAAALGLNSDTFRRDIDSSEVKDKINKDLESGMSARIQGTPTFFLNGRSIQNPTSYDGLKVLVETALKSVQ